MWVSNMFQQFHINYELNLDPDFNSFFFKGGDSKCKDIQFSSRASGYEDLWHPKEDGITEIYYSYEACLPENVIKSSNGQSGRIFKFSLYLYSVQLYQL